VKEEKERDLVLLLDIIEKTKTVDKASFGILSHGYLV